MKKLALVILYLLVTGCARTPEPEQTVDVVLIGGGIMSTTLGTLLHDLEPDWTLHIYERLDQVAAESSEAWNNAGTGHAAYCELNYTPEDDNGHIDISRAVSINESFEISRQFWAYQTERGVLNDPRSFINDVPHMSFVHGEDNVAFLRNRYDALQASPLFHGMEYSEDPAQIGEWAPLLMQNRDIDGPVAATHMAMGTDVNFGELTRQLTDGLTRHDNVTLSLGHQVDDLERNDDGTWTVTVTDLSDDSTSSVRARFVFIGAGGAALTLLQKSGIPESRGYGGFPVGGQFLVTRNPEIAERHSAKVYGQAATGAPPMSVPHLDTRYIDGEKVLLFGPFATFSTRFLKEGSLWDLFGSLRGHNLWPMTRAGLDNFDLTRYLMGQLRLDDEDRLEALREYFPDAQAEDWELVQAGQRVQIIKRGEERGGILQFGTEVVMAEDGSLAALLGASPGASTAAPIMLSLIKRAFPEQEAGDWQARLQDMIPSYGQTLNDNPALANEIRGWTSERLGLNFIPGDGFGETEDAPEATAQAAY